MSIFNRIKDTVKTIRFAASPRLYGRSTAGTGDGEEISIGTGLTLTGGVLSAVGDNLTLATPPVSTNEIKATGSITVAGIPTIGQTLTIGGIVYTFTASQVNPFDIAITEPASITTVATAITTRINARDRNVVATRSGAVITLTAIALREDGNLVTLTTTASNLTLSGLALTGGASTIATATTGNNMQHAIVASRHVFICVNSGFSTNWILIS